MLTRNYCGRHYVLPSPTVLSGSSPAELDRILSEAVRVRLPPNLPVSALFSGGIDSTLIAHYARRFRPEMPAYIAVGSNDPDRIYAERYADLAGLDLHEVSVDVRSDSTFSLIETVVDAVEAFESAVIRSSVLTYRVRSEFTRTASGSPYVEKVLTSCLRVTSRSKTPSNRQIRSASACASNAST
jgi:asparagine synthase (glutamine-hydrolysing)